MTATFSDQQLTGHCHLLSYL